MSDSIKAVVPILRRDEDEPGWEATIQGQPWYFRDADYGGRDGSRSVAARVITAHGCIPGSEVAREH